MFKKYLKNLGTAFITLTLVGMSPAMARGVDSGGLVAVDSVTHRIDSRTSRQLIEVLEDVGGLFRQQWIEGSTWTIRPVACSMDGGYATCTLGNAFIPIEIDGDRAQLIYNALQKFGVPVDSNESGSWIYAEKLKCDASARFGAGPIVEECFVTYTSAE